MNPRCFLAVAVASLLNAVAAVPPSSAPVKSAAATSRTTALAFEKLAKSAEAAREANHVDEAIALYRKAAAIKPSWDEGWWFLGSLNYDLDQYVAGRDAFRRFVLLKPEVSTGWAMLGLCEFQTKQYDQALPHLGRAVALGIDSNEQVSTVTRYHFALVLTREEKFEESMKELVFFAQRGIDGPNYVEAMGLAALRKPLLPEELPPGEREIVMDTGRAMFDASARRASQASTEFQALIAKYPDRPQVHYLYATFLLNSDENAAVAEMKKELEISPGNLPAAVTLAAQYTRTEEYKAGLPYAEKAVEIDPHSFAAHAVLGRILSEGDIDAPRGLKELEEARRLEPGSPQVRIALATAYAKAGRKGDAAKEREEFQKLRKQADGDASKAQ